jgi:hypothetical protein
MCDPHRLHPSLESVRDSRVPENINGCSASTTSESAEIHRRGDPSRGQRMEGALLDSNAIIDRSLGRGRLVPPNRQSVRTQHFGLDAPDSAEA